MISVRVATFAAAIAMCTVKSTIIPFEGLD
jgi:hypothetical protein